MVENSPINYAYGYQYGLYNNTTPSQTVSNDSLFLNTTQPIQQDTYTPQFTGTQEEPKKLGTFGKILIGGVLVGGAYLLGRNWNAVTKWVKGLFGKGGKPLTDLEVRNAREAEIVENINLSHVNGKTRKLVEKAGSETVTAAQQEAYNASIAYQKPTLRQKVAIKKMHKANAAQRAELNSLANNSKGAENLATVSAGIKAEAKAARQLANGGIRHTNGNIYHIENGAVTRVELYQNGVKNTVELTDAKKIARHLAKHNVNLADLVQPKTISQVA